MRLPCRPDKKVLKPEISYTGRKFQWVKLGWNKLYEKVKTEWTEVRKEAVSESASSWVWAHFLQNIKTWQWHLSRHSGKRGVKTQGEAEYCIWHLTSRRGAASLSPLKEREREKERGRERVCVKLLSAFVVLLCHPPTLLSVFVFFTPLI